MSEFLTFKDHSSESKIYLERVTLVFALFILLSVILVARYFYLQLIQYQRYSTMSENNRLQTQPLLPARGLIFDRNGELLADNSPAYTLTIVKERVGDLDEALNRLKTLIDLKDEQIDAFRKRMARRSRSYDPVPIRFRLSQKEIAMISVNRFLLPGIDIEARLVRNYPKGELMAHAIGSVRRINEEDQQQLDRVAYSGTDHIGKIGFEKHYEKRLLGKVGYQRVETNVLGRVMKVVDSTLPQPGMNLTVHLDAGLQQAASDALGSRRGAIVAIEPSTGGFLALVSKPSYDPNPFVTGIDEESYGSIRDSADVPLFNRALQGQYEPGSTLKPFVGLIGLSSGAVDPLYTIDDPGWFQLPDEERLYRDWNWTKTGLGGHGKVNFQKAIYRSCNTYFFELALKLGIDELHAGLGRFGFGLNTTIDLPEARKGLLPSREWKSKNRGMPWFPGDTLNIGIGQGDLLVTPLQLAVAVSVLANRGKWVRPRLLKNDVADDPIQSPLMNNVDEVPPAAWDAVFEAMGMVVHRGNKVYGDNGTAWYYIGQKIAYRMAGKSGTAQVVGIAQGEQYDKEELTERQRKHAWFVGFAPVTEPKIAVAVLVENGGGGSEFAAPVVRQIIDHHLLKNNQHLVSQ